MRAAYAQVMEEVIPKDDLVVLLLGDIGVHSMRNVNPKDRVINFGIREQSMVNVAAGFATQGFYPIVHTIEPFLCERALEQIKLFAYNGLRGLFVTCGGSYDYAGLGCTHHCPAGPGNMLNIPGLQVHLPANPEGAGLAIRNAISSRSLAYVRLVDGPYGRFSGSCYSVAGTDPTRPSIVTTGTLDRIVPPDMPFRWHTHLSRLDDAELRAPRLVTSKKILLVEEFYTGTMTHQIIAACDPLPVLVSHLGVPRRFLTDYGTKAQMEESIGLTSDSLRIRMDLLHHA